VPQFYFTVIITLVWNGDLRCQHLGWTFNSTASRADVAAYLITAGGASTTNSLSCSRFSSVSPHTGLDNAAVNQAVDTFRIFTL
jgi:hypothetical protein